MQDWAEQIERLLTCVSESGISCAPGAVARLEAYCRAVCDWTKRTGLVAPADLPLLVQKHVGPGLGPLLLETPEPCDRWIDVGTGGGFPGMVLKLCRPDLRMTLLDSSRKKTIFLERVKEQLEVADLEVVEARVEALHLSDGPLADQIAGNGGRFPAFEVILMRAVAPLGRALPLIEGIAGADTRFLTFKGKTWEEELAKAQPVLTKMGWKHEATVQIPWAQPKILKLVRVS
ncbi:MAG: 16S rRNA (guanine(527)-N(7))-methyltransferase RsmG [Candidatus Eisenbacteria sp.]|nr:16S rRNA (guanine(527)-N(7))-methyltransferase RsmG [Candidatus Eisenbacteria bacterium]